MVCEVKETFAHRKAVQRWKIFCTCQRLIPNRIIQFLQASNGRNDGGDGKIWKSLTLSMQRFLSN